MDYAPRRDKYGYDRNGGGGNHDRRMNHNRQYGRGGGGGYGGRSEWRRGGDRERKVSSHRKQSNDPDFSRRTTTSLPVEDNVKSMVAAFAEQELLQDPVALPPGATMPAGQEGDPSVVDMVVEAAGSLGMQSSIYALFTALASLQDGAGQFSARVLDGISKAFISAFSKGAFVTVKLLLRFMGELCNCGVIDGSEFGRLLQGISGEYVSAGNTEVYQPVKDLVCYVVLAVLPWCGSTLEGQWSSGLDELIEVLGFHMDNRLPIVKGGLRGTFVRSISKENEPDGEEEEEEDDTTTESLQVLWALVRAMHKQGWKESTIPKSIPQPWRSCAEELSNVIPIPLPGDLGYASIHHNAIHLGIISASSYDGGNGWVEPRNTSRYAASNSLCHAYTLYIHGELELFDEDSGQEAGTIGSLHPKEKLMLCDFARDVLACMQPFIQTDGTRIGSFSSVVQQLLSVGKLAPQKCYIEYLIVELMLQALLIVPQPPCWSAYIQRVLLELCCAAPDIAPRALAFTTGTLFHEITAMDTSVTLLFGNWFAYHLKDISTNWPLWKHWSHVIEADPLDPQRIFLSVALQKFAKLCQPDRVRDAVPEELWPLAHLHFDAAVVGADQTTPIHVSSDSQGRENDETDAATPDSDPILDAMLLPLTAAAEGRSEITADGGKGEEETSDIPGSEKVGGKLKNSLKGLVSILKDENNTYEDVRAWLHYQASLWGEQKEQYGRTVPERTDSEHSFELYYGGREIEVVLRAILRAAGPNPLNIRELLNQYNEVLGIHIVGGQNNNERNLGSGKPPPNPTAVGNNETQQAVQMRLLEVVRRAWPTREEGVRHSVLSSQMFHSTVDSLLAEKVISPLAVVNYAFESSLDNCVYDVLGGGWDLLDSALRHAKRAAALDSSGKVVKGIEDDEMDCLDVQMEEEFANDKNPRLVNDSDASVFKTSTSSEADEIQLCSELILRCTDVLPLLSGEKRHIASCLLRRILRRCLSRRVLAKGCVDSMRAAKEHGRELDSLERDVLNFAIEEATKPKAAA